MLLRSFQFCSKAYEIVHLLSCVVVFTFSFSDHSWNSSIYKDGDRPCVELVTFSDADKRVEGKSIQTGYWVSLQNCETWWKHHRNNKDRNQNYHWVALLHQVSNLIKNKNIKFIFMAWESCNLHQNCFIMFLSSLIFHWHFHKYTKLAMLT